MRHSTRVTPSSTVTLIRSCATGVLGVLRTVGVLAASTCAVKSSPGGGAITSRSDPKADASNADGRCGRAAESDSRRGGICTTGSAAGAGPGEDGLETSAGAATGGGGGGGGAVGGGGVRGRSPASESMLSVGKCSGSGILLPPLCCKAASKRLVQSWDSFSISSISFFNCPFDLSSFWTREASPSKSLHVCGAKYSQEWRACCRLA
mmetsp:Transcript_28972/g.52752  ORF Transcript_28972/g.52752 Transcript_28972/m.52752 type:complete len:207 (-) Transcript_28972:173-793(-)